MNENKNTRLKAVADKYPHNFYQIATALRGPDSPVAHGMACSVKWLLTSRLRAICFKPNEAYGDYNDMLFVQADMVRLHDDLTELSRTNIFNHYAHWIQHLTDAISATADEPIWNGFAQSILMELRGAGE